MRRNKYIILFSLCLIPFMAVILLFDLAGVFGYSDLPFLLAFLVYAVFIVIQQSTSRLSFGVALLLLIYMGLSYIPTAASRTTERFGEWFCLFFIAGIIQYTKEAWLDSNGILGKNAIHGWDDYYIRRIGGYEKTTIDKQLDLHARWYKNWLDYIQKYVKIFDRSLTMFEIGSGMGGVLNLLSSYGVPVIGSDISKKAMSAFLEKYPSIAYIVYDIEQAPHSARQFDRVLAFEVLEHIKNIPVAIYHIKKLIKKGGYFIGTTPYPYSHVIKMQTHINVHDPEYWKREFIKQGFSSVRTLPVSVPPLLWRIHPKLNFVFPFYVPFRSWVSTTLIIARI